MSSAEVLHRLREARTRRRWRRRPIGWDARIGDGPIWASPVLRARLGTAAALPGVAAAAHGARIGRLRFLGREWPEVDWVAGAGTRFWLHDPITGRLWPGAPTPAFAVDARSTGTDPGGTRLGDAKYVWEPGRLQFLPAAAAAGDARTALAVLRDFADANPPYAGIHWVSGIEIALRLVSVTLVCAVCAEALAPADRILIRRLIVTHAEFLAAFPSLHSSANNHRMAEGLGLYLASLLAPDLCGAWAREGRAIVEDMVRRLVLPDGGGAEQSPVYLAFVLEMAALAALLAAEDGAPFPVDVLERLARGAAFLRALLDGAGRAPAIGDDDETRVIAQPPDREPRYVASVVAAVAGLLGRPELAPPARDPHLRDALFAAPGVGPPLTGVRTFSEAGYTTAHETLAGRRVHLVFDHGPLGYGALAAHGHADALAVWLSVDGEPVLIDAGTWLYFSASDARLWLRESGSHNSLSVRGASQSRASSAFGWSSRARARVVERAEGPAGADWSVTAAHDGYRGRFGLEHRRRIAREGGTIVVGDRLVGGSAPVDIAYLLPGDVEVAVAGRSVTIARAGALLCRMVAPEGFTVTLQRGAAQGAVRSAAFGEIEEAQRLVFAGDLGGAEAVTRLHFEPALGRVARESLNEPVSVL